MFLTTIYLFPTDLYPFVENNLVGYIDENFHWKIEPQYNKGGFFVNGYTVIENFGEVLVINDENEIILELSENSRLSFSVHNEYLRVKSKKGYSLFNLKNKECLFSDVKWISDVIDNRLFIIEDQYSNLKLITTTKENVKNFPEVLFISSSNNYISSEYPNKYVKVNLIEGKIGILDFSGNYVKKVSGKGKIILDDYGYWFSEDINTNDIHFDFYFYDQEESLDLNISLPSSSKNFVHLNYSFSESNLADLTGKPIFLNNFEGRIGFSNSLYFILSREDKKLRNRSTSFYIYNTKTGEPFLSYPFYNAFLAGDTMVGVYSEDAFGYVNKNGKVKMGDYFPIQLKRIECILN